MNFPMTQMLHQLLAVASTQSHSNSKILCADNSRAVLLIAEIENKRYENLELLS
jgi:hypothetical protein